MKQHTTLTVKPWVYRSVRSLMIQLVAIGVFFTVSAIMAEIREAVKDQEIEEAYKADPFAGESERSRYLRERAESYKKHQKEQAEYLSWMMDEDAQMERDYPNGRVISKSDVW